jgi:hypothetical protein
LADGQQMMARLQLRSRTLANIAGAIAADRFCAAHVEATKASSRSEFTQDEQRLLSETANTMRDRARAAIREIPDLLPKALHTQGLSLHPSSRHPRYLVDGEFISIQIDDKSLTASVSSRGGAPRRVAADVESIVDTTAAIHERLFGRQRKRLTIDALVRAYRSALKGQSPGMGTEVPIERVREALVFHRKTLPQDEFNVDLAHLLTTASTGKWRLSLANTRQTDRGLLLHGMEETGYVGYLKVEERHG